MFSTSSVFIYRSMVLTQSLMNKITMFFTHGGFQRKSLSQICTSRLQQQLQSSCPEPTEGVSHEWSRRDGGTSVSSEASTDERNLASSRRWLKMQLEYLITSASKKCPVRRETNSCNASWKNMRIFHICDEVTDQIVQECRIPKMIFVVVFSLSLAPFLMIKY